MRGQLHAPSVEKGFANPGMHGLRNRGRPQQMSYSITDYIARHKEQMLAELKQLCSYPTIADGQEEAFTECESFLVQYLNNLGFQVRLLPTQGRKVLYAELHGRQDRSLLFYNHYDVVDPGCDSEWDVPPFSPAIVAGKLYGRGTSDHKGSLLARLHAVRALLAVEGTLPVTVKFLIEGEEELGSPHLREVALKNRSMLQAEGCLYPGWRRDEKDRPRINAGSRGSFVVRLSCATANRNLHEAYAPVVPNALTRVIQALGTLFNEEQQVTVQGFCDGVHRDNLTERAIKEIPFDDAYYRRELKVARLLGGVNGERAVSRNLLEPTLSVFSVRASAEKKDVLPTRAEAWLRFQLVPDQEPLKVYECFKEHLVKHGFGDLAVSIEGPITNPSRTPLDSKLIADVLSAGEKVYGTRPVLVPVSSGSGPKDVFIQELGIPTVADVGVGYSKSNDHGPNEHIRIQDYWLNVAHIAEIIWRF